jgi:hypothetical protein
MADFTIRSFNNVILLCEFSLGRLMKIYKEGLKKQWFEINILSFYNVTNFSIKLWISFSLSIWISFNINLNSADSEFFDCFNFDLSPNDELI